MITKPLKKITEEEKLSKKELTDIKFKEAETGEKEAITLIKKLEVLELLLSAYRPGEKEIPGSDTNWEPIITEDYDLKIIRNKIIQLIKEL